MEVRANLIQQKRKNRSFPNVYSRRNKGGTVSWLVDLGLLSGKRVQHFFKTRAEALSFAEHVRIKRQNEGLEAFNISSDLRIDAIRAAEFLTPMGISLVEAAKEYANAAQILKAHNATLRAAGKIKSEAAFRRSDWPPRA